MKKEFQKTPSALIIATKRSGTNFVHDFLSVNYSSSVNEPLGLHHDVPFHTRRSSLDPWEYSSRQHVSEKYGHTRLKDDPYGALITKNFLDWLREGGKLIKETDFLYL